MFQRIGDDSAMKLTIAVLKRVRALSVVAVVAACVQQSNAFAQNVATLPNSLSAQHTQKNAPIVRGSLSPMAPVKLDYRIAHPLVANQQNSVSIEITSRLDHGSLLVEVAKHEGISLVRATQRRFDLASATHPIKFDLPIIPADQSERFLVLLLTVDTEMGPMSRSFRIDLSAPIGDDAEPSSIHE
jgi:hypothetical protein